MAINVEKLASKIQEFVNRVLGVYAFSGGDRETILTYISSRLQKDFGFEIKGRDGNYVSADKLVMFVLDTYRKFIEKENGPIFGQMTNPSEDAAEEEGGAPLENKEELAQTIEEIMVKMKAKDDDQGGKLN